MFKFLELEERTKTLPFFCHNRMKEAGTWGGGKPARHEYKTQSYFRKVDRYTEALQ